YWVDVVFNPTGGGPADTTAPGLTSKSPANGATGVSASTTVSATFNEAVQPASIKFTLTTAAGAAVSASVSYNSTTFTAILTPTAPLAPATTYSASVSGAKDTGGNTMPSALNWSFTTAGTGQASCPCSIWPATAVPTVGADADTRSIEVGVKFRTDISGFITGVRFYKAATNTGTHIGSLWTSGGASLGQVTFTNESAAGWQLANFSVPIAVSAGTTYVVSYHADNGHYADDIGMFAARGIDNGPLHALRDGVDGLNGVYSYGDASVFPSHGWQSSNYWVDVVFKR
ncbi:MAG: DUF4082 domain-containing protein, partial [Betaproteobacteria bacterium]